MYFRLAKIINQLILLFLINCATTDASKQENCFVVCELSVVLCLKNPNSEYCRNPKESQQCFIKCGNSEEIKVKGNLLEDDSNDRPAIRANVKGNSGGYGSANYGSSYDTNGWQLKNWGNYLGGYPYQPYERPRSKNGVNRKGNLVFSRNTRTENQDFSGGNIYKNPYQAYKRPRGKNGVLRRGNLGFNGKTRMENQPINDGNIYGKPSQDYGNNNIQFVSNRNTMLENQAIKSDYRYGKPFLARIKRGNNNRVSGNGNLDFSRNAFIGGNILENPSQSYVYCGTKNDISGNNPFGCTLIPRQNDGVGNSAKDSRKGDLRLENSNNIGSKRGGKLISTNLNDIHDTNSRVSIEEDKSECTGESDYTCRDKDHYIETNNPSRNQNLNFANKIDDVSNYDEYETRYNSESSQTESINVLDSESYENDVNKDTSFGENDELNSVNDISEETANGEIDDGNSIIEISDAKQNRRCVGGISKRLGCKVKKTKEIIGNFFERLLKKVFPRKKDINGKTLKTADVSLHTAWNQR